MASLQCPSCPASVGPEPWRLRRHLCSTHLAYRRFRCLHCPASHFTTREDAVAHASLEGHAPDLVEEPEMELEETLGRLIAEAFGAVAASPEPPPSPAKPCADAPSFYAEPEDKPPTRRSVYRASRSFALGQRQKCQVCGNIVSSHLHVLVHMRKDLRAILCGHCPPDDAYGTRWVPSKLKDHTLNAHPNQPIKFIDERPAHRAEFDDTYDRCFVAPTETAADEDLDNISLQETQEESHSSQTETAESEEEAETTALCDRTTLGGPGRKRGYQKKRVTCAKCRATVTCKSSHVVIHFKQTSLPALVCRLCPADSAFSAAWFPREMRIHSGLAHPDAAAPDFADLREEKTPIYDGLFQECFGTGSKIARLAQ